MGVPLIPENILETLANQLESGFDPETKVFADKRAKQGTYAMELALEIDEEGSFRSDVHQRWLENEYLVTQRTLKEKILQYCAIILLGPALIIGIPLLLYGILRESSWWWLLLILTPISWVLSFKLMMLPTKRLVEKYRSSGEEAAAILGPWKLFEDSNEKTELNADISLGMICEKLGVDPAEAKIGMGKVKGGGSTYVGWGSGRAVGAGIALSTISSMRARSQNSATNGRIKELENYLYYNNVAAYYSSENA